MSAQGGWDSRDTPHTPPSCPQVFPLTSECATLHVGKCVSLYSLTVTGSDRKPLLLLLTVTNAKGDEGGQSRLLCTACESEGSEDLTRHDLQALGM